MSPCHKPLAQCYLTCFLFPSSNLLPTKGPECCHSAYKHRAGHTTDHCFCDCGQKGPNESLLNRSHSLVFLHKNFWSGFVIWGLGPCVSQLLWTCSVFVYQALGLSLHSGSAPLSRTLHSNFESNAGSRKLNPFHTFRLLIHEKDH